MKPEEILGGMMKERSMAVGDEGEGHAIDCKVLDPRGWFHDTSMISCRRCRMSFYGYLCQDDEICYLCVDRGFICQECCEWNEECGDDRGMGLCRTCTRNMDYTLFVWARPHNGHNLFSAPELKELRVSKNNTVYTRFPALSEE